MQVAAYLAGAGRSGLAEVGWLVACPIEEHSPIYQRLFGFVQPAEPRRYFGLKVRTSLPG